MRCQLLLRISNNVGSKSEVSNTHIEYMLIFGDGLHSLNVYM